MKLTKEQKDLYAEKFLDLGNLSAAGLTFGSILMPKFNLLIFFSGIIIFFVCYITAYYFKKGD